MLRGTTQGLRRPFSIVRFRAGVQARPEVALLVSTYQKPGHLRWVLASIAAQERVEGRIEVVVTDDGSTDETHRIVRQFSESVSFPVVLTSHPHAGFQLARCRNEGAAASTAPYLLFLDGDCVLPPDHVETHLTRRRPNYAMCGYCCRLDSSTSAHFDDRTIRSRGYTDRIPRTELRALAKRDRKARFYRFIHHPTKPKLTGGNLGVWRQDFERVNGFDENFEGWGGEDTDLGLRLRRVGVSIDSILRWTYTYHLWHPPDATAPKKIRDGLNHRYLNRRCRLTRCMNGLARRKPEDLVLSVVGQPQRMDLAHRLLGAWCDALEDLDVNDRNKLPEVEVLCLPGSGKFSGRADCNILVVLNDSPHTRYLARKAHIVVSEKQYPQIPSENSFKPSEFNRAVNTLDGMRLNHPPPRCR